MAITKDRQEILELLKGKKVIAVENPAKPKQDPNIAALVAVKNAIESLIAKQPIVNVKPQDIVFPVPAKKWLFTVDRDKEGLIKTVTAKRVE